MMLARSLAIAISLVAVLGCSGRTVRLDHEPALGSAGAASDDTVKPELVYQAHGAPLSVGELLVDDERIYWQSDDQAFRSCLKRGCQQSVVTYATAVALDSNGLQLYSNIAVSAGQAFWLARPPRGTIYSCPRAGCSPAPTRLLRDPALQGGYGLAADEGDVYWLSAHEVYRCPAAGCAVAPQLTSLGEGSLPTFFGGEAFWIQHVDTTSRIRRAPKDGSADATTFVEVADAPDYVPAIQEIAVSDLNVYWLDETSRVLSCPRAGCDGRPSVLETEAGDKQRLRADELGVYWLDASSLSYMMHEAVHFCPNSGCGSTTALGTFDQLGTYALDSNFIYWTAHVPLSWGALGGDIQRMPKPGL